MAELFLLFCRMLCKGVLNEDEGETELEDPDDMETPDEVDEPDELSFELERDLVEEEADRIEAGIEGGTVCGGIGCAKH